MPSEDRDALRQLKRRAREAVRAAERRGELVRPDRCEGCRARGPLQADHEDYGRPLEVSYLCSDCHAGAHLERGDLDEQQVQAMFGAAGRSAVVDQHEDPVAYLDPAWPDEGRGFALDALEQPDPGDYLDGLR